MVQAIEGTKRPNLDKIGKELMLLGYQMRCTLTKISLPPNFYHFTQKSRV